MSRLMTYSMASLIIILFTVFIFFIFEGNIKEAYAEATAKQTCRTSVRMHSVLKLRYADFSGEIKCPTIKLTIDDKNQEIAKKKLADAMFDCWDQFGRGTLDLFSDDSVYCSICHRITFGKDVKINGFTEYLATKPAPGQKISYLQFLTTERTQDSGFLKELENREIKDTIDASKNNEYAIVFTYIKGKKYLEEYAEKAKFTVPGVGLMAVGVGLIFKAGPAAATIPYVGIAIAGAVETVGVATFGIGALWSYLAVNYAGVPFEHISLISFIPYDAKNLENLKCKEIQIKQ